MNTLNIGDVVVSLANSGCGRFKKGELYGVVVTEDGGKWVKTYDSLNNYNGWASSCFKLLEQDVFQTMQYDVEYAVGDLVMAIHSYVDGVEAFRRYEVTDFNNDSFPKTLTVKDIDTGVEFEMPRWSAVIAAPELEGEEAEEVEEVVDTKEEDVVSLEDAPEVGEVEKQYITDPTILKEGDYIYFEEEARLSDPDLHEGLFKVTKIGLEGSVYLNHLLVFEKDLAEGYLVEVDIKPIKREKPVASYRAEDYIIVEENGAYKVYERKA